MTNTAIRTTNVGLDMDGVIVDFVAPVYEKFELSEKDLRTYKLLDTIPSIGPKITQYYSKKSYFKNLDPYPGSLEFIRKLLHKLNVKVWFVSKPSRYSIYSWSDKAEWIKEHIPELLPTTILTQNKSVIAVDIFVDDVPENLETSCAEHKFLFDQPWNQENKVFNRVENYDDLYEQIRTITEQRT